MTDINKYEIFLNELTSLENHVLLLLEELQKAEEKRFELEKVVQTLKKENEYYKLQMENQSTESDVKKSEKKYQDSISNKEKEQFRQKVYDLIGKIDNQIAQM